eukprot:1156027-Pelagomonas_calceolata.AAC.1
MYSTPTPVPPPRSTQIRSLRCASLAAHAASMGLRPHRKFARNLSSAMVMEDHALGLNRVTLAYIHEFEMGTGPAIGPGRGWPKYLLAGVPACLMHSLLGSDLSGGAPCLHAFACGPYKFSSREAWSSP